MSACAALPETAPVVPAPSTTPVAAQVTVRDRAGPVPANVEKRVIAAIKAEGKGELAEHHLRVLAASGDVDLYRGNATKLLVDGPATFAAMKRAIERARARIWLESYIVEDSELADEFAALLVRKASEGVRVAMIYDAVGSFGTDAGFFDGLGGAGVAVCKFNPVNPLERPGYWSINHRDHRKLLVVDEEVAFTGGINISRVYASNSRGGSRGSSGPSLGSGSGGIGGSGSDAPVPGTSGWRDTHIELRGPVVQAFARGYEKVWKDQGCEGALAPAPKPSVENPGQRVVKLLESDPRDADNRIYTALLAAIDAARESVHLTMAYFAPGDEMIDRLAAAARRGVDVVMVLPGRSDFTLVLHAGRSYYDRLLAAGVRIHEMDDAVMHAKTAVIDGVLSTVGSSNLDWRSFVANNEVNAVVVGEDFARELEALFDRDLQRSRPIELQAWRSRGLSPRVMEWLARMAERLL